MPKTSITAPQSGQGPDLEWIGNPSLSLISNSNSDGVKLSPSVADGNAISHEADRGEEKLCRRTRSLALARESRSRSDFKCNWDVHQRCDLASGSLCLNGSFGFSTAWRSSQAAGPRAGLRRRQALRRAGVGQAASAGRPSFGHWSAKLIAEATNASGATSAQWVKPKPPNLMGSPV